MAKVTWTLTYMCEGSNEDVVRLKHKVRNSELVELVKYVNDYVGALGAEVGDDLADWRVEVRKGYPQPSADPDETPAQ